MTMIYLPRPKKPKRDKLLDRFGSPLSDSYCTPPWLTQLLPRRDLDPCSNPRSTVNAKRAYSLDKGLDGLRLPWNGTVYENWPYSNPLPWAEKTIHELAVGNCTDAIVLIKLDSSTRWFSVIAKRVLDVIDLWIFNERIQHDEPPELIADRVARFAAEGKKGGERSSNNFCSAIIHHRRAEAPMLECLVEVATRWSRS